MAKKKKKLIPISAEFKENLLKIITRPEFSFLEKFLQVQQNNVYVIQWFRIKSTDVDIVRKKAYYEGQYDMIKQLLATFEELKKGTND